MKWAKDAEEAVSRVPFFVRRRVRRQVEEEAARSGSVLVTLEHVERCRKRYLEKMADEVKGYQVETCFGLSGCPNRAVADDDLAGELERLVASKNLREFLKQRVRGPLKLHHEFRVSTSDCPNACSRPQIVDVGLIAALRPQVVDHRCNACGACAEACKEDAIELPAGRETPVIDAQKCLSCGQCVRVCPTAALREGAPGYRILVGGKLGRHPQLATELPGIYSKQEALEVIELCLDHYQSCCASGERFGEILNRTGLGFLEKKQKKDLP